MKRLIPLVLVIVLMLWALPVLAQTQPVDPNIPGFDFQGAVKAAGIIVVLVNLLKNQFGLSGDKIKYVVMAISGGYAIVTYQVWLNFAGTIGLAALAFAFTSAMAMGGWETAKILVHKVGPKVNAEALTKIEKIAKKAE